MIFKKGAQQNWKVLHTLLWWIHFTYISAVQNGEYHFRLHRPRWWRPLLKTVNNSTVLNPATICRNQSQIVRTSNPHTIYPAKSGNHLSTLHLLEPLWQAQQSVSDWFIAASGSDSYMLYWNNQFHHFHCRSIKLLFLTAHTHTHHFTGHFPGEPG